ncbi:Sjogren's syndrome/scleroderma autoantigen 1 family protein [Natrialbaceae archaeon A-arb3/5]
MSDFDKEAEREKLREKYERDQAEREATQRMSDLLLKGATMTNSHCGTCGDPLFQENGTTFCPSCHGNPDAVEGTDLEAQPADEPAADSDQIEADIGRTPARNDAPAGSDARPQEQEPNAPDHEPAPDAEPTTSPPDPQVPDPGRSAREVPNRSSAETDHTSRPAPSQPAVDGDVEAARDSLVRALEKFAGKAAETDDPRYATECLEAAREASETLETLR